MKTASELKNRLYQCGILAAVSRHHTLDMAQAAAALSRGGVSAIVLNDNPELDLQVAAIRKQQPECLIGVQCSKDRIPQIPQTVNYCFLSASDFNQERISCPVILVYTSIEELSGEPSDSAAAVYLNCSASLAQLRKLRSTHPKLSVILNSGRKNDCRLLAQSNVLALVNADILSSFDGIAGRANDEMCRMYEISSGHLGINAENYQQAKDLSEQLSTLLGKQAIETWRSFLIGGMVEVMHFPYRGKNGHFGILTNSLPRAMQYFRTKGAQFDMETYEENAIVYLCGEYGGFEFHLTQKKQ